jgi:hypothetical protein
MEKQGSAAPLLFHPTKAGKASFSPTYPYIRGNVFIVAVHDEPS